jgi:hypothetical protein
VHSSSSVAVEKHLHGDTAGSLSVRAGGIVLVDARRGGRAWAPMGEDVRGRQHETSARSCGDRKTRRPSVLTRKCHPITHAALALSSAARAR